MKYLDSNIFIYAAIYTGKKAERAREILKNVVKGDIAITSTLTIDEVIWAIWREVNREKAIIEGLKILEFPNLNVLDVSSTDVYSALNFMKKYPGLKPRAGIHLSVSLNAGVFRIISDDPDFDEVKEIEREKL